MEYQNNQNNQNMQNNQNTQPQQLHKDVIPVVNFLKTGTNALFQIFGKNEELQAKNTLSRIPRFTEECTPDVICLYVGFEINTFNTAEKNIVLYLFDEKTNRGDFWRGSLSTAYANNQNNEDVCKTYIEKTFDQLKKVIDVDVNTVKWRDVMTGLMGKRFPVWVSKKTSSKGKEYYAICALGSGGFEVAAPIGIPDDLNLGMLLGGNAAPQTQAAAPAFPQMTQTQAAPAFPSQQVAPQTPQAAPPANNPFAKMQ